MCGISGIYSNKPVADPSDRLACERMLDALLHRGPDGQGMYVSERVILGHRRLAIIDLSEAAKQPISNEDGSVWLSFNGEIYNFRSLRSELEKLGHSFKSQSDGEIIVHLYEQFDVGCLDRLEGMFAFALWDVRKKRLLLARDRFGMKPLYYSDAAPGFVFASEANAVLASGFVSCEYRREALIQFLQYGVVSGQLTAFKHIHSLPPAHYALKDEGGFSIHPYWNFAQCMRRTGHAPVSLFELRELFQENVKRHLVSDAPLGILLSGGMDSSSLVALASKVNERRLHTVTLAFEEESYDESLFAQQISDYFDTVHHERTITASDVLRALPAFFQAMDQPTVDGLNTFMVAESARDMGFKVLLSGLGGDEVFAGYSHLKKAPLLFECLRWLKLVPKWARGGLVRSLSKVVQLGGVHGADRLNYLEDPSVMSAYRAYRGLFPPDAIQKITGCSAEEIQEADDLIPMDHVSNYLDLALILEFDRYLHDQLLRDTDVMSMRNSLEMRVPFLDHKLVEAVFSLPLKERFHRGVQKKLLRDIVGSALPTITFEHPKRGFVFPLDSWMRSSLRPQIEEVLLANREHTIGGLVIRKNLIERIWREFLSGKIHWSRPWALFVFMNWLNRDSGTSAEYQMREARYGKMETV